MENGNTTIEEVTINKKIVRLTHEDVPLSKVVLDDDNPRIRYRLKLALNGHGKLDSVVMGMPEVKKLKKDIEDTGGLRERVILQEQDGMWKAVEGNCRVVCYKALNEKYPNDPKWKKVPAKILPRDVEPKQVAILLADFHVAQKIAWKPHEKAGHVYRMVHDLSMTPDEISTYLRASKSSVYRLERAYEFMIEKFLKIDKGAYKDAGERKWSYFEEFFKLKPLRDRYDKDSDFGNDFCRWVGDGRLPEGENVRDLPEILANADAYKKFVEAPVADAFRLAMKIVEQANPEYSSVFFGRMADFRESCKDAANVKDILLIRSNKAARERVLETFHAFVDFMRLADVEPPPIN